MELQSTPLNQASQQPQAQPSKPIGERPAIPKGLLTVMFLGLAAIVISAFAVPRLLVYLTRAAKPTNFSLSNSYIFGSPLVGQANGQDKVRITVFLLDQNGRGVAEKQVSLSSAAKEGVTGNAQISNIQPITDNFGKAVFEVVSSFAGQFAVSATADGLGLPQAVTVTFR